MAARSLAGSPQKGGKFKQQQGPAYTHFLSIPLSNDSLKEPLEDLQRRFLRLDQGRGIHPSIFIDPCTLHLTLGMLSLADGVARERAVDLLASLQPSMCVGRSLA